MPTKNLITPAITAMLTAILLAASCAVASADEGEAVEPTAECKTAEPASAEPATTEPASAEPTDIEPATEVCERCGNTGKIPCPVCKNNVEFWCSECHQDVECNICGGIGWILCDKCGGENARAERDFLLEQRKQHKRVSEAVGTKLRLIETPRFRLFTDIDHQLSHQYALLLESFCRKFNETFGHKPDEKLWQHRCDVYLFQPREAFVKFAVTVDNRPEVAASGGYSSPSPAQPLIVLFNESRSGDDTVRTIIHELAHVYLDLYYKTGPIPQWVHEGVAQNFEFMHKTETSRREKSLETLRKSMNAGMLMPLHELSELKINPSDLLPYAASWSGVEFLMQRDSHAFIRWIKEMKDGIDQHTAFRDAYGRSMASLTRPWFAHIRRRK